MIGKLQQPIKIRCPHPTCRYEWMRPRAGFLKENGDLVRSYYCPVCGTREVIIRKMKPPSFSKDDQS